MFCKKCETEQKDGRKYCPKCGEPFLDENGKPYRLARQLDDSDEIIEEARESKRKIDKAFEPMFGINHKDIRNEV